MADRPPPRSLAPPGPPPHSQVSRYGRPPVTPGRAAIREGRAAPVRLVSWWLPSSLLLLGIAAVTITVTGLRRPALGAGDNELSPARTVAAAYWAAVRRGDAEAVRRLLCDEDRLVLAPAGNPQLLALLRPGGRRILDYTIIGQSDGADPVVSVALRREEHGRLRTVIRATPVVDQAGVLLVCFHRFGLPLGR